MKKTRSHYVSNESKGEDLMMNAPTSPTNEQRELNLDN